MSSINEKAVPYLLQDIRDTDLELMKVASQIEELEARRDALEIKAKLLRDHIGQSPSTNGSAQVQIPDAAPIFPGNLSSQDDSETPGFREHVKSVLADAQKGMRGMDVTRELSRRKIHYSGKTDLAVRVANELYRMHKAGHIRKRGKLYYAPEAAAGG